MVSPSESCCVAIVLEDCLDRLNIMGEVMETSISKHMSKRTAREDTSSSSSGENNSDNNDTPEDIFFGKKKQLLTEEEKLNEDRKHLEEVLAKTSNELQCSRTYQAIVDAINEDQTNKLLVLDLKKRIHAEQQHLENLKEISRVQKGGEGVQNEMEMVVYKMRDQLQKSKARLDLEVKYIFKESETSIVQAHKLWNDQEREDKIKSQHLRSTRSYEERINIENKSFMDQDETECEEKLDFWQKKFIADVEKKDEELEVLKKDKALNLKKIQELSRRLQIYETVVENDRIEKQIEKEKKEQEEREYNCIVKVQAWWRGMMVRKKLGPFAEQEKKPKKGKGGKKGKGKGKK